MNEDELRAALRQDAGDSPDAESVVAAARASATRRRVRLLSTASSVAVVAAIAVTVGVLTTRGGDSPVRPSSNADHGLPAGPGLYACPGSPDPSTVTTSGSTTFGLTPGRGVLVCAYGSTGSSGTPASLTLTGNDATRFVASLNEAPTSRPHLMCPQYRVADDHRFAFVGVADGPVTTTLGNPICSVVVSSPAGTRYAWAPPADLAQKLLALQPTR